MNHARRMWELLLPLGPYRQNAPYTAAELAGEGAALDRVEAELEELEREAMPDTAEDWGLERLESLLIHRPVAHTPADRRAALAALLRIGGDSFTLAAINDNLRGCGLNASVSETASPGVVEVRFPDVPGIPEGFDRMRSIIEEILPCHLQVNYVYWYVTWQMVEGKFPVWQPLGEGGLCWETIEKMVR